MSGLSVYTHVAAGIVTTAFDWSSGWQRVDVKFQGLAVVPCGSAFSDGSQAWPQGPESCWGLGWCGMCAQSQGPWLVVGADSEAQGVGGGTG